MVRILVQSLKIVTIALSALFIVFGSARAFEHLRNEVAKEERYGRTVTVTIRRNDDAEEVAQKLKDSGLINSELYFTTLVRFSGKEIRPETYRLTIGSSARTIVDLITTEKSEAVAEKKELRITVIEGWRVEQVAEELDSLGLDAGYDGFMEAARSYENDQFDFLEDRPNKKSLEGYLFPDTYTFNSDSPPDDIIQVMLQNFEDKFDRTLRERARDMGLTVHEVLTFASLVEREAQITAERAIIAGVYINRFEQGIRLDADPTVQYALGKKGEWWPKLTGDDLFAESDYNTYQNNGLPPGPICNPGIQSILGVLQPAQTDYIYFVAHPDGDGTHLFAVDVASRDQNVNFYLGQADAPAACSIPYVDDCGYISESSGEAIPIQQSD
jgi:UPF0755 protein